MKKILFVFPLLLITLITSRSLVGKPFDVEEYQSLDELAAAIAARFPAPQAPKAAGAAPKPASLAIVPVKVDRPDIVPGLVQRLTASGRFIVIDTAMATAFVKETAQEGPGLARKMLDAFNLDGVVALRAYPSEGKLLVTARIFSRQAAKPQDTIVALLDLRTEAGTGARPLSAPAADKGTSSPALPFPAIYIAAADLDGDGKLEYVFSDGERLHVLRLESAAWAEVWTEPRGGLGAGARHIYLDVADINANNRPEIFVTFMRDKKALSAVFEARDGAYNKIAELPGFVRVVRYPGRGPVLVGQDHSEKGFFEGSPKEYSWSGKGYAVGPELPLPKGVNLYGFAFADFGEARPLMIALDGKNRVRVYSQETLVWESREMYGAAETVAVEPDRDAFVYATEHEFTIKGRVAAADIDGDGKEEVILPKNIRGSFLGGVKSAEVHCLGWTGARLEQECVIKDVPGEVLDFQVIRQAGAGSRLIVLVQTKGGILSKPAARVVVYSLK